MGQTSLTGTPRHLKIMGTLLLATGLGGLALPTDPTHWGVTPVHAAAKVADSDDAVETGKQGTAKVTYEAGTLHIYAGDLKRGNGWWWDDFRDEIERVVVDPGARVIGDASEMFADLEMAEEIDVQNLDVSQVTTMYRLFADAGSVTELQVGNWDTSQVTDLTRTFQNVEGDVVGLENWDTSQVTTMDETFEDCRSTVLEFGDWDTSQVTSMAETLRNMRSISILDIHNWDMRNVTNCRYFLYQGQGRITISRMAMMILGPQVNFKGAKGTQVIAKTSAWRDSWQYATYDKHQAPETLIQHAPVLSNWDIQEMYTSHTTTPQTHQYVGATMAIKLMGKQEKVYDGQPAVIDPTQYRAELTDGLQYQLTAANLKFETDQAPTEPGTYRVVWDKENDDGFESALESQVHELGEDLDWGWFHDPDYCGTYTIKGATVKVRHVTTDGQVLAEKEITGKPGADYDTAAQEFDGYQFVRVDGATSGQLTAEEQTVTYVYQAVHDTTTDSSSESENATDGDTDGTTDNSDSSPSTGESDGEQNTDNSSSDATGEPDDGDTDVTTDSSDSSASTTEPGEEPTDDSSAESSHDTDTSATPDSGSSSNQTGNSGGHGSEAETSSNTTSSPETSSSNAPGNSGQNGAGTPGNGSSQAGPQETPSSSAPGSNSSANQGGQTVTRPHAGASHPTGGQDVPTLGTPSVGVSPVTGTHVLASADPVAPDTTNVLETLSHQSRPQSSAANDLPTMGQTLAAAAKQQNSLTGGLPQTNERRNSGWILGMGLAGALGGYWWFRRR